MDPIEVWPGSLRLLLTQLWEELGVRAEVSLLSPHFFKLEITSGKLLLLFYPYGEDLVVHMPVTSTAERVIHLDEDCYLSKNSLVLSRIRVALGQAKRIYARDTQVRRIRKSEGLGFQETHHLQVALPGKYRYGLFYGDQLVSVAIFSGGRRMRNQVADERSFELLRFCHESGYVVVGGLSKLLKAFITEFHPGDIMTYVDRDWSDGRNYLPLGFEREGEIPAQSFLIDRSGGVRREYGKQLENGQEPLPAGCFLLKNLGSIKMRCRISPG